MGFKDRKPKFDGRERSHDRESRDSWKSDDRSERRSSYGERKPYSKESFSATCSACGNECTVPFKPTSGKPIYCRDCFQKKDKFSPAPRTESLAPPRESSVDLSEINKKLDKIIRALEIEDEE